jgi:excisionase family DNA binding protein
MIDVMEPEKRKMLSPQDVAERLKMSLKTVYRRLHERKIKSSKLGGQWRIRPEDLEDYIDQEQPTE